MKQWWVVGVLLLAGCAAGGPASAPRAPENARNALAAAEAAARTDPALRARAGWLRYLIASDSRGASEELTAAAQSGPAPQRALAYAGLGELAEDRTDSLTAIRQFIAALQTAPTDPIAELAALRLLDLECESPQAARLVGGAT